MAHHRLPRRSTDCGWSQRECYGSLAVSLLQVHGWRGLLVTLVRMIVRRRSTVGSSIAVLGVAAMLVTGCTSSDAGSANTSMETGAPPTTRPATVLADAPTPTVSFAQPASSNTVVVASGDSLSAIAAAASVSLADLLNANSWSDGAAHVIHPGDVVVLPVDAALPAPRPTTAATAVAPAATSLASTVAAESGGYRSVGPDALLDLGSDGISHSIDDPLANGIYYAESYALTANGAEIQFNLARFASTEACIATLDTVTEGTVDQSGCYGGLPDTSTTAVVTMPADSGVPVILVTADYGHLEVSAREFARLLDGEPPAVDAPSGFEFQPYWDALVEISQGRIVRADQRRSS